MLLAISLIKSKIKINSINTKPIPIEIPLIKTQELKPGISLKTSKKINQMLKELTKIKTEKGESTNINFLHKKDKVNVETCCSNSETMMKRLINIHIHQNYLPIKKKKKKILKQWYAVVIWVNSRAISFPPKKISRERVKSQISRSFHPTLFLTFPL